MIRLLVLFTIFFFVPNDIKPQQTFNKNIYGFATSNTFTYFNISSNEFKKNIDKISPNVLRFPGGAVGNFYHLNGPAYGMKINEIDSLILGKFPKRARGLLSYSKKSGHKENYINNFIELAKYSKSSAVLVANVLTESKEDIIKMIKLIKENDIDIIGVELGSEMSNKSYFDKGYTIDIYIKKCEEISDSIKYVFPKMKTAIVAAPLVKNKKHRHFIWNKKLSELNFYDAIIIHSYAKVIKGKGKYGQMVIEKNEGNKDESFSIYSDRVKSFFEADYPKEISNYNSIFNNKPIWITEWNLQYSKKTGNTHFQGMFVANFFLELISNEVYKEIELTTFHNLAGRDFGGSIFQKKDNKTYLQSTFVPIQIVSRFFNDKDLSVMKEKINNKIINYKFFKNNQLIYECLINWSNKEHNFDFEIANSSKISICGSPNLYDLNSEKNKIYYKEKLTNGQNNFVIRPYSITLIE